MLLQKYRLFVLGAGFSRAAGFPLAEELWREILAQTKLLSGRANKFNDDLEAFISFKYACDGSKLTRETVNFEEFLGFLDVEHYLGLRGSDTWSEDGNEGQLVVKCLIGELLSDYHSALKTIPEIYLEFVRRLQPHDYILTFNYDVLLERALETVGKPYRLFPDRYETVESSGGTLDVDNEEIIILKLHGSVDWFDKSQYLLMEQERKNVGRLKGNPQHVVFDERRDWGVTKLLEGPCFSDDPLRNMYRVTDIEGLYAQKLLFRATPEIITPSVNKIVYATQFKEFWRGLGRSGILNFGMVIIGYSLPTHDMYARQVVYSLVRNYQQYYWGQEVEGLKKSPLVLVDYRPTREGMEQLLETYRFVDFKKATIHETGFDVEALDKIFS